MQYMMKQKLLAWGDDYYIKDNDAKDVYFVDGKAFTIGDQLSFQDLAGNELAFIKQRVLSWGKTYEISHGGNVVATVKKDPLAFFKHRFTVEVPGIADNFEAEGNLSDHEYSITRGGQVVATVSKQWFTWADTYGIDIRSSEDQVLLLAVAVVIDEACHPDDGHRH
jgi:uncharacterized protein YxjI